MCISRVYNNPLDGMDVAFATDLSESEEELDNEGIFVRYM
jgi:hypothetical protein